MMMTTDKAYIMGLVVGGGGFSSDQTAFSIRLPYRQWGDVEQNPQRAGLIAKDILQVVKPLMKIEYGLEVSYIPGREWKIECSGDTAKLISDLREVNIEPTSDLHKTADISLLVTQLIDNNMKKRFIAGIADTIGSMAESHRRFSDDVQIISFEISGFNYRFVCQLCNLLYDVGCVPDQILWQHPNMQSGIDAYYRTWKKGNKLRVTLDSFSTFGSHAFKSKAASSKENRLREPEGVYNAATKCEEKSLSVPGVVTVHVDENHPGIPEEIRGGHYIHHKQLCAVLNCPHAPKTQLDKLLAHAEEFISPFTVLHKGYSWEIANIIQNDEILKNREYVTYSLVISDVLQAMGNGATTVLFEQGLIIYNFKSKTGYPLNVLLDAIAFVIASKTGNLNGKRPRGSREIILSDAISADPKVSVKVLTPEILTPIVVTDDRVAAMISPLNPTVYKKLITYSDDNQYKMMIRKITENDLKK